MLDYTEQPDPKSLLRPFQELRDKVAIVTGGSRGVGGGIVDVLAECGVRIMIAARSSEENEKKVTELSPGGARVRACATDVSIENDVERMIGETIETYGTIDILVNNAGLDPRAKWDEITSEEWDRTQEVNSKGYYLTAKHAAGHMTRKGWGRIINISSSAFWLGHPDALHYVTSKGANIAFTRSLALALKKTGVTVNCVAPGAVETPREWELGTEEYCASGLQKIMEAQLTEGRLQPADVGWLVAFLCTDAARFINGQTINMDGGRAFH